MLQAYLLDKYGPRLDMEQLGEVLGRDQKTILNQISANCFSVPTYIDGRKRWADFRDVAEHLERCRSAALADIGKRA